MSQSDGGYGDVQAEGNGGFAYKVVGGDSAASRELPKSGQRSGMGVVRTHKYKETKVAFKHLQRKQPD